MKTSLKLLAVAAVLAGTSASQATVIVDESFQNYSIGTLTDNTTAVNATGLTGNIRILGTNTYTITAGTLSYSGGSLSLNGGSQYLSITGIAASGTALDEQLATSRAPSSGSFYQSFLYQYTGTINNGDVGQAGFQSTVTGTNGANAMSTGSSGAAFRTNVGGANTTNGTIAAGNVNFIVVEYLSSGTAWTGANVWINPTSSTQGAATYTVSGGVGTATWLAVSSIATSMESGDAVNLDRYIIGTTWSDVVVPEPSTWMLIAGAGTFLMITRRRKMNG